MKQQSRILAEREKMLAEAEKEKCAPICFDAVSHDLRTPLTGIIGASSSYLENEEKLDTDEKRATGRAISAKDANWLLNMVEKSAELSPYQK